MYILLNYISKECRGHTKEKDCQAECPFCSAFGKADVVRNFLTENGPAINSTDTAVKQQCRNRCTHPLVLTVFHNYTSFFFIVYLVT
jgi:hypothetical protein